MMYYFSPAAGTGWHTYKSLGWEVMHQAQECTSDSVEPILSREASEPNRPQKVPIGVQQFQQGEALPMFSLFPRQLNS